MRGQEKSDAKTASGGQQYDARALTVAKALYAAVLPETVVLFGSRARGDYRDDSDIDLLVVTAESGMSNYMRMRGQQEANRRAKEVYGNNPGIDIVPITKAEYLRCRRGINHVAGQATRDGITMSEERLDYRDRNPDENPIDWPDVQQRVINADRDFYTLELLVAANGPQESVGFHAQQTLENILKGWLSATGTNYRNRHDLAELIGLVREVAGESETPAGEELAWLTWYAVAYRYEGARVRIDDPLELHHALDSIVGAIKERIKELTGVAELPRYER
jgi:HEPN domain-containing protein